jgi:hypothetical protein
MPWRAVNDSYKIQFYSIVNKPIYVLMPWRAVNDSYKGEMKCQVD